VLRLTLAPFQRHSVVRQEHGRTIPLSGYSSECDWADGSYDCAKLWPHPHHRRRVETATLRLESKRLRQRLKIAFEGNGHEARSVTARRRVSSHAYDAEIANDAAGRRCRPDELAALQPLHLKRHAEARCAAVPTRKLRH
jgi:hypothetical protein